MTLPASGLLTLGDINVELGRSRTAAIQLDKAENGDYGTINTCSPSYPSGVNPAKMSEWYNYNHNAVCSYSTLSCFFPADNGVAGSMLQGDDWNNLSTSNPLFDGSDGEGFSYGAWLLPRGENNPSFYMSAFHAYSGSGTAPTAGGWTLNAFSDVSGDSTLYFEMTDTSSHTTTWTYVLNNSTNSSVTGIPTNKQWGVGTMTYQNPTGGTISFGGSLGNINPNNFMRLDITYDAALTGINRLKVYWNAAALTPETGSGGTTLNNVTWSDQFLNVGGSYSTELGSTMCWDEVSFFYENRLTSSEVSEIYNNGAPQDETYYSFSYDNLLYRFEQSGNLGNEYNGSGMDLNNVVGTPTSSTQHA
tara:strand:- start:3852 stop:4934 length:1083 start_codon:yes stop_codon:yes gene_type:complete